MPYRHLFCCLLLLTGFSVAAAQVKLETVGPLKEVVGSPEVAKALAPQGHRVVLGNGNPLCQVWLVTSLPSVPKDKDTERTNYSGKLSAGELVGAIQFPQGAKDFRGQAIKPGAYTLRYAVMPNDGAHMGAAPERDFLLLVPLATDAHAAAVPPAELLKASSAASGTNHPAVFLLLAATAGELPRVYENPDGYVVFAGKAGSVPLALVVKGQAEQ